MRTNKKYYIGFAGLLLLGIASCSLPTDYDAAVERDADATIRYKEDAKTPQPPADTDVIRVKDDIWLGDTSEIEYEGDKPLPSYLETADGVTLVSNRPITLYEIGSMISQITSIKTRFAPQIESTAKAAADRNAPSVNKVGTKWSDTSRMLVSYKGSLSGLLDEVCSYFGVWWKYENDEIYIYKYTTKTFTLYTLPTKPSMTASVSSSSGGGTITNGLSGIDLWKNIVAAVKSMLGKGSSLVTDPMNGTLTVTATPTEIKKVAKYVHEQNIRLSRQVAISIKVLQVDISEDRGFGFDLNAVFKDRTKNGGNISLIGLNGPAGLADGASKNSALSMKILSGDVSVDAAVKALATQGTTTLVTSGTVTTMNNKPAPIQVVTKQNYVSEITKTNSGSTGDNYDISVQTDEIETGFTMDVLPRVMDHGRLMMLFSLSLSDLLALEQVEVDPVAGSYVQNPKTVERGFSQEISLKSGDTLVLAGYERTDTTVTKEGLGAINNNALGGNQVLSKTRSVLVILLTPVVLESPLLPESRMRF